MWVQGEGGSVDEVLGAVEDAGAKSTGVVTLGREAVGGRRRD